jgi:hypothetical protein
MADVSGPLFNGDADRAVRDYCHEVTQHIADEAALRIKLYLPTQYKYLGHSGGPRGRGSVPRPERGRGWGPGYYASQVHAEAAPDGYRVTDSGVIYGPWLEGESERNMAYRFPGYHAFRKICDEMERDADTIAEEIIPPYLERMNQ